MTTANLNPAFAADPCFARAQFLVELEFSERQRIIPQATPEPPNNRY